MRKYSRLKTVTLKGFTKNVSSVVRGNNPDSRGSCANNVVNRNSGERRNSSIVAKRPKKIIQDDKASVNLKRDSESANRDAKDKNRVNNRDSANNVVSKTIRERKNSSVVARRRPEMKIKDKANVTLRRDSESANRDVKKRNKANNRDNANNVANKSTEESKNNNTAARRLEKKKLTHKENKKKRIIPTYSSLRGSRLHLDPVRVISEFSRNSLKDPNFSEE